MTDLSGRCAVVTGGARGIGRAFVEALAGAGAHVAIFDVNGDAARRTAADLGGRAAGYRVDVADEDAVNDGFEAVTRDLRRVDILVNNAGVRSVADIGEHSLDAWRATLDVNLTGAFLCARAAIPHMLDQGKGKIVNVASTAGVLALTRRAAYNVSKAGLLMLTKLIAVELAARNIYCNAIEPGVIETDLNRDYFSDEQLAAAIRTATPVQRWGEPSDLVGALLFLVGDGSDFVNGTTLFVDGGWTAGKGY